jgi:hypothetical protein
MQVRLSLPNWLTALIVIACVTGCGWKPRSDTAVLRDGSFGGVEIQARDPGTGRPQRTRMNVLSECAVFFGRHRLVLPAGENVLVLSDTDYNTKLETVIQVIPDTLTRVLVDIPAPDQESRLIPAERCAIIKGTITAGNTGRPMAGVAVRAGHHRLPARSDSLGHYRLVLPGSRHRLRAWYHERTVSIDTFVAPGESAAIDLRMRLVLESPLLFVLGKMEPEPRWRVRVLDATADDSDVIRAAEEWTELDERETDDTLTARTFAAFELFGTASRGKWLTAYGRERHVECFAGGPEYKVSESRPCLLCLLHLGGHWVAVGSWREQENVYAEDMFPAKYQRLLRLRGRLEPDPLEARVEAKVAAWESRMTESRVDKP